MVGPSMDDRWCNRAYGPGKAEGAETTNLLDERQVADTMMIFPSLYELKIRERWFYPRSLLVIIRLCNAEVIGGFPVCVGVWNVHVELYGVPIDVTW